MEYPAGILKILLVYPRDDRSLLGPLLINVDRVYHLQIRDTNSWLSILGRSVAKQSKKNRVDYVTRCLEIPFSVVLRKVT